MTILPTLRSNASVVRRVVVGDDFSVDVTDNNAPTDTFRCMILEAARNFNSQGDSPRERPPATLWYAPEPRGPQGGPLAAADRVMVKDGTVWELLGPSRPLRAGRHVRGFAANVLPVPVLYPAKGDIVSQSGEVLREDVIFTMFGSLESRVAGGEFQSASAEAPIEFLDDLEPDNRQILVGTTRIRVTGCVPDYEGPRCLLTLRTISG